MFFFEKKNQKTSIPYGAESPRSLRPKTDKSLFASFSSEKEDSSLLPSDC
jgi:hypothetical protein